MLPQKIWKNFEKSKKFSWPRRDLNTQPSDLESDALPLRHEVDVYMAFLNYIKTVIAYTTFKFLNFLKKFVVIIKKIFFLFYEKFFIYEIWRIL